MGNKTTRYSPIRVITPYNFDYISESITKLSQTNYPSAHAIVGLYKHIPGKFHTVTFLLDGENNICIEELINPETQHCSYSVEKLSGSIEDCGDAMRSLCQPRVDKANDGALIYTNVTEENLNNYILSLFCRMECDHHILTEDNELRYSMPNIRTNPMNDFMNAQNSMYDIVNIATKNTYKEYMSTDTNIKKRDILRNIILRSTSVPVKLVNTLLTK